MSGRVGAGTARRSGVVSGLFSDSCMRASAALHCKDTEDHMVASRAILHTFSIEYTRSVTETSFRDIDKHPTYSTTCTSGGWRTPARFYFKISHHNLSQASLSDKDLLFRVG